MKFTENQTKAITTSGHDILVSASAGSGKTAVLINRILYRLIGEFEELKEKGTINDKLLRSIENVLVVTFTEAASKEMQNRLVTGIQGKISEVNRNNWEKDLKERVLNHLNEQLIKINIADISTLHAFCLRTLKKYYYVLDLDPKFRLLTDESELAFMQADALEKVFNDKYEENNSDFKKLLTNFAKDRNNVGLEEIVFALDKFASSTKNPTEWLKNLTKLYQVDGKEYTKTLIWKNYLKKVFEERMTIIRQNLKKISTEYEKIAFIEKRKKEIDWKFKAETKSNWDELKKRVEEINEFIQAIPSFRKGTDFKKEDERTIIDYRKIREKLQKKSKDLIKFFKFNNVDIISNLENAQKVIKALGKLVINYRTEFQKQKQRKHLLDFNDLEQNMLTLLNSEDSKAKSVQRVLKNRYKEILVDEYQDTNEVQEAIINKIASNNLFTVGDVKQSIYRFRLADPTLFTDKFNNYRNTEKLIILQENFRSVKNIAAFTNLIFTKLMDKKLGEIDYDEDAKLQSANKDLNEKFKESIPAEIMLYKENETNQNGSGELRMVAAEIKNLVDSKVKIYDKGILRNITYRDIAVLASTRGDSLAITEEFKKFNVPVEVDDASNYFKTTEIQIMLSLLKIIDNPRQDIPLVAVLRSPMYEFNEKELSWLKILNFKDEENDNGDFYKALLNFSIRFVDSNKSKKANKKKIEKYTNEYKQNFSLEEKDFNKLNTKVRRFFDDLKEFRIKAKHNEIATLIWMIYQKTGFLDYVLNMPDGKRRQANLHALYQRANQYEQSNYKGLFQFLRFVKRMEDSNKDLSELLIPEDSNVVKYMTIHKSKGLEFPYVFLINANKQFNISNSKSYIITKEGIGINYIFENPETITIQKDGKDIDSYNIDVKIKDKTPVYNALKEIKISEELSEEMRKLYVALTRAEQKIYIVGSYKSTDKKFFKDNWQKDNGKKIDFKLKKSARNYLDWICYAISNDKFKFSVEQEYKGATFKVTIKDKDSIKIPKISLKSEVKEQVNKELIDKINNILDYKYPNEKYTKTASYQSVTDIKELFSDKKIEIKDGKQKNIYTGEIKTRRDKFKVPDFIEKGILNDSDSSKITSALLGTAIHLVFKKIDVNQEITKDSIKERIIELNLHENIAKEVKQQKHIDNILAFYQSKLGKQMLKNKATLKREEPFAMIYSAKKLFNLEEKSDRDVLIHGIIDGYFEDENGKIIIFDYKTDQNDNLENIGKKYQGQLHLYAKALEDITGKKVSHEYIYSTYNQKEIDVKKETEQC